MDDDIEAVKTKRKRKTLQIQDSEGEEVEEDHSEVIRPKVKRKPPLIEGSEIKLSKIVEK